MCTSLQMKSADGNLLFARTMDWHAFEAKPFTLPQKYQWQSVYNNSFIENKYAILAVGKSDLTPHVDVSDGINEFGLVAQKLTFSNRSEYAEKADSSQLQLAPFEFVLWLLGNCKSVAEVREKISEIQLMTDDFSNFKYGRNDLHFSLTDATGEMINIEPIKGRLEIVKNTVGVVTNAPDFEKEVEKLKSYMDFSDQPVSLNGISTGKFSGKPVFPGGFTPTSRFIRATLFKERALTPNNISENIIETWHILNSVTVPKSSGRSDTYTVYRSAVDIKNRQLYFQGYDDLGISIYRFPD